MFSTSSTTVGGVDTLRAVKRTGSNETVSERLCVLDRVELHPREDLIRVGDASKHDVALCRLLAADRIFVEERFPGVEVVDLEMMNHESHCASSDVFGAAIGPLRMMLLTRDHP